jgi:hypothetical protein
MDSPIPDFESPFNLSARLMECSGSATAATVCSALVFQAIYYAREATARMFRAVETLRVAVDASDDKPLNVDRGMQTFGAA